MTLEQLENEVLALPQDSLIHLFTRLIEQLGKTNEIDREVENDWLEEAEARDHDLTSGEVIGYPASQVFADLRASLA
ncbi:MAG: addiction module protein [Pseudanabaena sp. Salubria-1]|jgi:hypothetical protein|uniref:Addiction module component, TIGR02574 family n=2 Tax=Pseudanabaena TaxID=1152 RepID=L8N272_9CYAN|nr:MULTISPECIES: addiction module protein [Pseudanabaena]ELS33781.1 hypothetical protein Pse7429DRAFT_1016 [Pseudanabaena biceps PCC 7429]MCL1489296.1 addiction module protein [Pseudanabaena sp. Salubria-1]MDG3494003.1 addiction module protein [Pseudanabaena catenata USMAC16]